MKFTLVICTYMRPKALIKLLKSVANQTLYPNQIIVVDGSINYDTKNELSKMDFKNLEYYLVDSYNRGLTRQRNFSIKKLRRDIEVICFLDDDVILEDDYFKNLLSTYIKKSDAIAVGGYITNEVNWMRHEENNCKNDSFCYDGWTRKEPFKLRLRKQLGLSPQTPPGFISPFSHGRSVSFLPPSGKIYEVEHFMGGVSSYKTQVFSGTKFSTYFEGYGLYEDLDFCIRLLPLGKIYLNTAARLGHYHEALGRPNQYKYGKMVIRNGWYVWRLKNNSPIIKDKFKWHLISLLQTLLRFLNIFNTKKRFEALSDATGRIVGWLSLFINTPKIK